MNLFHGDQDVTNEHYDLWSDVPQANRVVYIFTCGAYNAHWQSSSCVSIMRYLFFLATFSQHTNHSSVLESVQQCECMYLYRMLGFALV